MNVELRPLEIKDAYTSVKWRNDKDVFKYTGNVYDHEITIESELEWIQKVIAKKDDCRFAIIADGKYVGNIYLTDIHPDDKGTYHIFIGDKDYWGKGVASAASRLIIGYGFNTLNLKTIELRVKPENISAVYLYEKLGFKYLNTHGANDSGLVTMILKRGDSKPV